VKEDDTVSTALDLLRKYEISQLPVMRGHEQVGSMNDVGVMQAVFDRADILHQPVSEVMGRPFPTLDQSERIELAYKLLTLANAAIVVTDAGEPIGVVTRQDIISYLSSSRPPWAPPEMKFSTRAIHAGQEADPATGATIVPIYQTSTYTQDAVGVHKGFDYSRTVNRRASRWKNNSPHSKTRRSAARSPAAWRRRRLRSTCSLPAITSSSPKISMAGRTASSRACSRATAWISRTWTCAISPP